jgi:uncharacterized UPF0160 family protein
MFGLGEKKKLVTHNGSFHTDDVFAAALLSIVMEKEGDKYEIIRTRDEEKIKEGDIVFDVGGVYDEEAGRFDHHQPGGAGARGNNIEYSSFGLLWKKFGRELASPERVWEIVDKKLVSPIDAGDNGQDIFESKHEVMPYLLQDVMGTFRRTWKEGQENNDDYFHKAVRWAKEILVREIIRAEDLLEAEAKVLADYQRSKDKRIVLLEEDYPYESVLAALPEPLFVVVKRSSDGMWKVQAVRETTHAFKNRKDLPKSWGGLAGEKFQSVSGVSDGVFCHRALFMALARSKEGAVALAERAISL